MKMLSGERALRVSQLGPTEWLDIQLGLNGSAGASLQVRSNGEHPIPPGFEWIELQKSGQGSPTNVELLRDA
jgi:hypothetical protein